MQTNLLWEEQFTLTSYDVDFNGRLSLYALFRRFQELAGSHATHLRVGYDRLKEEGLAWFLSRIKVEFSTLPLWGDAVRLQTWPKGIERLFAMREFRLLDKAGATHLLATSRWLLVDVARGRPRRIESLPRDLSFENVEHAITETPEKIVPVSPCVQVYEREVLPSDLDVNHHVNNAEYVKWVMDCFEVGMQTSHGLRSVQLNYLEETLLGDHVRVGSARRSDHDQSYYVEGLSATKGSTLFQAQVDWR